MATTYSDNFNRANGALGGSWVVPTGRDAPTIAGASYATGTNASAYDSRISTTEQWSSGYVDSNHVGLAVYMAASGDTCYFLAGAYDSLLDDGSRYVYVKKIVGGAETLLYSDEGWGLGGGFALKIAVEAGKVKAYAEGVLRFQADVDPAMTGRGAGFRIPAGGTLDNWSGGTLGGGDVLTEDRADPTPKITDSAESSRLHQCDVSDATRAIDAAVDDVHEVIAYEDHSDVLFSVEAITDEHRATQISEVLTDTVVSSDSLLFQAIVAPLLTVTDDFARPDGPVGPNWAPCWTPPGWTGLNIPYILGGRVTTSNAVPLRNMQVDWPADHSAFLRPVLYGALYGVRVQEDGCGYYIGRHTDWHDEYPVNYTDIVRVDIVPHPEVPETYPEFNYNHVIIGSYLAAPGDIEIRAVGDYISLWIGNEEKIRVADTTYSGGRPAIWFAAVQSPQPTADDFHGHTYAIIPVRETDLADTVSVRDDIFETIRAPVVSEFRTDTPRVVDALTDGHFKYFVDDLAKGYDTAADLLREPPTQVFPSFAAFGGLDPYAGTQKGVISRPGDRWLGGRKDIGPGDRVFFKVANGDLLYGAAPVDGVGRATLLLTVKHIMGYRTDSPAPTGDLFRVCQRAAPGGLDLATLSAEDALGFTLSETAVARVQAQPVWMSGQMHFDGVTRGNPIDQIELDVTALYNAALQNGTDLEVVLDCISAQPQTVVEFFGADDPDLAPRIDVARWGDVGITITDKRTAFPLVGVTCGPNVAVANVYWGYDRDLTPPGGNRKFAAVGGPRDGWATGPRNYGNLVPGAPFSVRLPMLDPDERVWVSVETMVDGKLYKHKRTFRVPRTPAPLVWEQTAAGQFAGPTYAWEDVRNPFQLHSHVSGDAWGVLAKSGGLWNFWRATNRNDSFSFFPLRENNDFAVEGGTVVDEDMPPWIVQGLPPVVGSRWYYGGVQLDLAADDVGHVFHDQRNHAFYFLSAHLVGGQYEVRLTQITHGFGKEPTWYAKQYANEYVVFNIGVVYTTTTGVKPNLKLSSITRAEDWRNTLGGSPGYRAHPPLLMAFVADGQTRLFSTIDFKYSNDPANGNFCGYWLRPGTVFTNEGTFTAPDAELKWIHTLTKKRKHRAVLVLRSASGACTLVAREDDTITWLDGGGFSRTPGAVNAPASFTGVKHVWATEPTISAGNGHYPDVVTCGIVLAGEGTMRIRRADASGPVGPVNDSLMLEPGPDWGNLLNFDRWLASRFPAVTGYQGIMHTAHGGCVLLSVNGTTFKAQRVQDYLRVSDEVSLEMSAAATEVYAQTELAWEGACSPAVGTMKGGNPVIVGSPGSYRVVVVQPSMDITRLDCPTWDMKHRFSSGTLRKENFVADKPNMRWPGIEQLPGHNSFVIGSWEWDRGPDGSVPGLLMNQAGFLYGSITGVRGQSLKLHYFQSGVGAGAWIDGGFRPRTSAFAGTPELIGDEWPMIKYSPMFWSPDSPETTRRRWYRFQECDWLYDGETGGGVIVVKTPTFDVDRIWVAHDIVHDAESWESDYVQRWKDSPYVWSANDAGHLLLNTGEIASQALVDVNGRKYTTWRDDYPNPSLGLPPLPEGENYLGFFVAKNDPWQAPGTKKLFVLSGGEDPGEHSSQVIRYVVDELTSGSEIARRFLSANILLVIPFENQWGTRHGKTRYNRDSRRDSLTKEIYFVTPGEAGNSLYNGFSTIGDEFIGAVIDRWKTVTGGIYAGRNTWHCDTHYRLDQTSWPYMTPYVELQGWPKDRFFHPANRAGFDSVVHPEFLHPAAEMASNVPDGAEPSLPVQFYFELPWR